MRKGWKQRAAAVAALLAGLALPLAGAHAQSVDYQAVVDRAHAKFKDNNEGANADYIPALDEVDPDLFAVVIVTRGGQVYAAGDADHRFSIQSVSKPFTAGLVMEDQGIDAIRDKIGVEPTGMPFNSIIAIEQDEARSRNPLVNAGAIAAVSMIKAKDARQRWQYIVDGYSEFAGEKLSLLEDVYVSEAETNYRNRAIAHLLYNYGRLYSEPLEATDVYTKQCSLGVSARQLGMMGATLANWGTNPATGRKVMRKEYVDELLAIMMMAGFYDEVGVWAYDAGLPAKTGVGGGIVAVVPGQMAIAAFSPRVNEAGNSIRAMLAIQHISEELNLSLFKSGKH
ncbi:MAG: glutaminase [Halioglobus sp.]|nr:glutaminase [Halioglobus sp.]|tara:strand:+ start:1637 stop:2656 length:1020 start_codon:yes stop_codon:yes gene_type:complete